MSKLTLLEACEKANKVWTYMSDFNLDKRETYTKLNLSDDRSLCPYCQFTDCSEGVMCELCPAANYWTPSDHEQIDPHGCPCEQSIQYGEKWGVHNDASAMAELTKNVLINLRKSAHLI